MPSASESSWGCGLLPSSFSPIASTATLPNQAERIDSARPQIGKMNAGRRCFRGQISTLELAPTRAQEITCRQRRKTLLVSVHPYDTGYCRKTRLLRKPCATIPLPWSKNGSRKFVGGATGKGGWNLIPLIGLIGGSGWIRSDRHFQPKPNPTPHETDLPARTNFPHHPLCMGGPHQL